MAKVLLQELMIRGFRTLYDQCTSHYQVPTLGVGGVGGGVQLVPALGLPGVQLAQLHQQQPQPQPVIGRLP